MPIFGTPRRVLLHVVCCAVTSREKYVLAVMSICGVLCSKLRWDLVCICECRVQMGVSWCWTGICLVRFQVWCIGSGCTDACVVPV